MITRLLAVLALLAAFTAAADVPVPALRSPVTDLTGTLAAGQRQQLERKLEAFSRETGSQVAVLLVPTTQPETIEEFSIRAAEAWKLGREKQDDGVLLVVAKNDRRLRIEVGYGLEGAIPDAVAKRVIEEVMLPRFRGGDFAEGIEAGVDTILGLIRGESLPPPERWSSRRLSADMLFFVAVLVVMGAQFLRSALGRMLGGVAAGGLSFFLVMLLLGVLWVALLAALLAFVAGALLDLPYRGGGGDGGWSSPRYGGHSGGGFGGGGFGGGFGGGGGGFGGGGASGSW